MIPDEEGYNTQANLLSGLSDLDAVSHLLAELHDDLPRKVTRSRCLADLGGALGAQGTMLSDGATTFNAWTEARSSFVHANFPQQSFSANPSSKTCWPPFSTSP